MFRRLLPVLVIAAGVLSACGGATLTDPKEIVAQGLDATGNLTSFHIAAVVAGKLPQASGTSISLEGTTFEGDVAVSGSAHLTFSVPTLLGLAGEMLMIDGDTYIKTTLTGPKWSHQAAPATSPDASGASASPGGAKAMVAKLKEFLAKEGVTSKKLDDVDCGGRQCYHVQVTVPTELLTESGAQASMDPNAVFGDSVVVDLQFDREKLYLVKLSVTGSSTAADGLSLSLTLSAFDVAVTVTPPPADEVQEGGFNFPGGFPGLPGS